MADDQPDEDGEGGQHPTHRSPGAYGTELALRVGQMLQRDGVGQDGGGHETGVEQGAGAVTVSAMVHEPSVPSVIVMLRFPPEMG